MKNNQKGFIALFSVIIITSVLLLIATSLSLSGFSGRFNIFDSESKKRSEFLAEACIESARLVLTLNYLPIPIDRSFSGSETIDSDACDYSVATFKFTSQGTIMSHSVINNAYTYYEVEVDISTPTIPITSFKECNTKDCLE